MNKILSVIILIIIVAAIFSLGCGAGMLYQIQVQKNNPQINKATEIVKKLTSKAIPSILAYGKIISIEGKNLTLSFNGESVAVKTGDNAAIASFISDSQGRTSQQNINFNQIKLGQTASINIKVLPDGQLQGESIMIFSSIEPVK
jgi:Cu/Ag efflux protein CusF